MRHYFTISINGQKAVDLGYKFQNGSCYATLPSKLGQLEVVIDEPGEYNSFSNKWVDVSYIKTGAAVAQALDELSSLGFKGCPCYVSDCIVEGCIEKSNELFGCIL